MSKATCFKCSKPIRYEQKNRYRGVSYELNGRLLENCNAAYSLKPINTTQPGVTIL